MRKLSIKNYTVIIRMIEFDNLNKLNRRISSPPSFNDKDKYRMTNLNFYRLRKLNTIDKYTAIYDSLK